MKPSDEVLMERYAGGDDDAFDEISCRYESMAHAFFVRATGCPGRARDLYQEFFLRVHRARAVCDSSRPFKPWFFTIANNLLIDDRRLAFRSREVALEERTLAEPRGVQDRVALVSTWPPSSVGSLPPNGTSSWHPRSTG